MWKKHSDNYSKHFEPISSQIYSKLFNLSNLHSSKTIVETSCGSGIGLEILRNHFGIQTKVHASDVSKHMIAKAKERKIKDVELLVAENSCLPYPANFCDRYLANLSLHIVRKREMMVQEAARVLKNGGLAAFSVFGRPSETNIVRIFEECCGKNGFWIRSRSMFGMGDGKSEEILRKAGFEDVETVDEKYFLDLGSVESANDFVYDLFLYQKLKQNSSESYFLLMNALRTEFTKVLSSSQRFSLEIRFITARNCKMT